jgi:hypothetical protein
VTGDGWRVASGCGGWRLKGKDQKPLEVTESSARRIYQSLTTLHSPLSAHWGQKHSRPILYKGPCCAELWLKRLNRFRPQAQGVLGLLRHFTVQTKWEYDLPLPGARFAAFQDRSTFQSLRCPVDPTHPNFHAFALTIGRRPGKVGSPLRPTAAPG